MNRFIALFLLGAVEVSAQVVTIDSSLGQSVTSSYLVVDLALKDVENPDMEVVTERLQQLPRFRKIEKPLLTKQTPAYWDLDTGESVPFRGDEFVEQDLGIDQGKGLKIVREGRSTLSKVAVEIGLSSNVKPRRVMRKLVEISTTNTTAATTSRISRALLGEWLMNQEKED